MRAEKKAAENKRIMRSLLNGEHLTVLQIAERVGLSEKTVRTKLDQLNDWLTERDLGRIMRKQGKGIWLAADESQKKSLKEWLLAESDCQPSNLEDSRGRQLIGKLLKLKPGETTTLRQLADSLYLSPPTVGGLLKEASGWFEERGLSVVSMRSKGVALAGEEYQFRVAIRDYMMDLMPEVMEALLGTFAPGVDTTQIRNIIVEAENAWRIELADRSFKMVWIMTCLSLARHRKGGTFQQAMEENIQNYNEYAFSESIYQRIEKRYQRRTSQDDVMFLALMLLTAKKMKNFTNLQGDDYARVYDRTLERFVRLIIDTIDSVLDIDLSGDELLYQSLVLHMRSAIFRMKYSTATGDHISQYVKQEYKQTFLATWSTSSLFEEYYDVQVTEDELAGIALYIQAAIIRKKKGRPIRALLVSGSGMAASQLTSEMLKYSIPEITEIETVSCHDFRLSHYPQADVIINTSGTEIRDDRAVTLEAPLGEPDIETVRQKVNQIFYFRKREEFHFDSLCHQLFEVDLFLIRPQVEHKDQLIAMMVEKLVKKGDVTANYLESVFDRERATTTSIGHGVAIPHGNMMEVNESRIVVAILDQPIDWHGDPVDVVFLLAVKMNSKFEIKRTKQFYKDFLQLTDSDEKMEAIKNMKSALDIYQYFIK